jgi:hypothetical protein
MPSRNIGRGQHRRQRGPPLSRPFAVGGLEQLCHRVAVVRHRLPRDRRGRRDDRMTLLRQPPRRRRLARLLRAWAYGVNAAGSTVGTRATTGASTSSTMTEKTS